MLAQTAFHRVFQLLSQMAHIRFRSRKRVHTRLCSKDRTQRITGRNRGCFRWGAITTLGAFHTFRKPCVAGGTLEEHRKPSEQRCAYACRCPEASRPRWAAQLYLFIGVFTFVKDLAGCCQYSSPITKGAADSNIRIGTLSGHDQNTPRRSKIQKLNAMRQHIRVLQCMALRLSG